MISKQEILNRIESGKTASQIFKEFDITYQDLRRYITLSEWNDIINNMKNNISLPILNNAYSKKDFYYDDIYYYILIEKIGYVQISKILNIPTNYIRNVCTRLKILEQLFANNQKFKSLAKSNAAKIIRLNKNLELLEIYKERIIEYLNLGFGLGQLKEKLNLPTGRINDLILMLGLTDKRLENSKKLVYETALKGSKIAAQKTKSVKNIRHIGTDEMKTFYCKCKEDGLFEGETLKLFKQRFGTSGSNTWNALIAEFGQIKKAPRHFLPGKENKMYGKEPDWKAGSGIKGHILIDGKLINFRSSLELRIYLYLYINQIKFELSKHTVKYYYNGKWRNYFQDIVIDNFIYEIKPSIKIKWEVNVVKFDALKSYCEKFNLKCDYITENTFDLSMIDINLIDRMIKDETIKINENEYNRLLKYSKKW